MQAALREKARDAFVLVVFLPAAPSDCVSARCLHGRKELHPVWWRPDGSSGYTLSIFGPQGKARQFKGKVVLSKERQPPSIIGKS